MGKPGVMDHKRMLGPCEPQPRSNGDGVRRLVLEGGDRRDRILDDAGTADSVSRDVFGLRYEFGPQNHKEADVTVTSEPVPPHES